MTVSYCIIDGVGHVSANGSTLVQSSAAITLEGTDTKRPITLLSSETEFVADSAQDDATIIAVPALQGVSPPRGDAAFLLVQGSFTDPAKRSAYAKALPSIYAAHGGHYLAVAPADQVRVLAGNWTAGTAIVLATFRDIESIVRFWNSDAYRAAKELRLGGGEFLVRAFAAGVSRACSSPASSAD